MDRLLFFITFATVLASSSVQLSVAQQTSENVNSIEPEPPGLISKEIFNLETPFYPKAFRQRTNIGWTVSKSDISVCTMTFIIKDLYFTTTSCLDGYLLIGDHIFCQTMFSERIEVKIANNPMELVKVGFYVNKVTDGGNKFSIMAIQHPETCIGPVTVKPVKECDAEFTATGGIFGKSKYINDTLKFPQTNCVLTFKRSASACGIKFDFLSFDMGSNCDLDHIIFDGKRYCEQQLLNEARIIPYPLDTFKDITITVNIGSKHFHGEGFIGTYVTIESDCPVACSEKYLNASFTLRSPGGSVYPNNADCEYTIVRNNPAIKCLQVDVKRFKLNSTGGVCSDYMQLFNPKRICSISQLPSKTYKEAFPVRKNFVKGYFHTDKSGQDSGFEISIEQLSENCPKDICQDIDGPALMESPKYPGKFPRNIRCKYIVKRTLNIPMKLKMFKINYDLAGGAILSAPDGENLKNIFDIGDTYELSLYNDIEIPFTSFSTSGPGFQLFLHQEPDPAFQLCTTTPETDVIGTFETPKYRYRTYDPNVNCWMVIQKNSSNICKVQLTIRDFNMAPRDSVSGPCKDYIDWSRDGRKCGTITEKEFGTVEIPFTQRQDKIFIKFFSDNSTVDNNRGAFFRYTQSSQNC